MAQGAKQGLPLLRGIRDFPLRARAAQRLPWRLDETA
jgi:hypothetical protein